MQPAFEVPDVLLKIGEYKLEEVQALKSRVSDTDLLRACGDIAKPVGFEKAIRTAAQIGPAIIAEIKKASPSKGVIREDFNPIDIASSYVDGGAACLSVLTDGPGFQGSSEIFTSVRHTVSIPMLRKDFMIDPIQITESRAMGADAILVILAMVDDILAKDLVQKANDLGMDCLIETHDRSEIERALALNSSLIGINNRNLRTFETSLETFDELAHLCPDNVTLIAESGIFTHENIRTLTKQGAKGFLIGESLMREDEVTSALLALRGLTI